MSRVVIALTLICSLLFVYHPVHAQEPDVLRRAVFVRIYFDTSFVDRWLYEIDPNAMAEYFFQQVRSAYKNNNGLHNVDLVLVDDVDRYNSVMYMNYNDPRHDVVARRGEVGGNGRLIQFMRDNLSTGSYVYRHNGRNYNVGRTVNWVFTHQAQGNLGGEANSTPALHTSDANLFVTTSSGGFNSIPLNDLPWNYVIETIVHEMGHILGATHEDASGCAKPPGPYLGGSIMCSGFSRDYRFSPVNKGRTSNGMRTALSACFDFPSQSACEQFADEPCLRILDYTQIAACQLSRRATYCDNRCTSYDYTVRSIINSMPWKISP